MLSKREKRIIEIMGSIEVAEETFEELINKPDALDDFEQALLRATIEWIDELKEELKLLKKGKS
ncbi:MAG: hypothetical protein AAGJ18_09940 [Bacteroidota bacterium]